MDEMNPTMNGELILARLERGGQSSPQEVSA